MGFAAYAIAGVIIGAGVLADLVRRRGREGKDRALEEAARKLGLRPVEGGLEGVIDGFAVTVERWTGEDDQFFGVTVDGGRRGEGGVDARFRLQLDSRYFKGGGDVAVGDPDFDGRFFVEGVPPVVAALLDSETRKVMLARREDYLVERGKVILEVRLSSLVGETVGEAVGVAQRLARASGDVAAALARNAVSDPIPAVRLRNLQLLARRFPGLPGPGETVRPLLEDDDPEIRFHAAVAVGDAGLPVLAPLVEGADGRLAAMALRHLVGRLPPLELRALLGRAVTAGSDDVRCAALEAVASLGDAALEGSAVEGLASAVPRVRLAAVEALGRVGTAASVPPLRGVVSGRPLDLRLRLAVDGAVTAIQGRIDGATAGRVSLPAEEGSEGRVSLAADEGRGRVGLAEERGERR